MQKKTTKHKVKCYSPNYKDGFGVVLYKRACICFSGFPHHWAHTQQSLWEKTSKNNRNDAA